MKYAALALQMITISILIIVVALHFSMRAYAPEAHSDNATEALIIGVSGLAIISFGCVLTVAGMLGMAARPDGIYLSMSKASLGGGLLVTVGLVAARIILVGF